MAQPQPPLVNINAAYFGPAPQVQQRFVYRALNASAHSEIFGLWNTWVLGTYFKLPEFEMQSESATVNNQRIDLLVVRTFMDARAKWAIVVEVKSGWPDTTVTWDTISRELYEYCSQNHSGGGVYAIGALGHLCKIWYYNPADVGLQDVTVPFEGAGRIGGVERTRMDLLTDGFWIEQKLHIIHQWAMRL